MIRRCVLFVGLMILLCPMAIGGEPADPSFDDLIQSQTHTEHLILLASSRNFPTLKRQAERFARRAHMPFSMLGRIFDPKRGIIVPDNDPDEMWQGSYFLRRDNEYEFRPGVESRYLSIECSDAYPGLKPGYYILVAGIYDTRREAVKASSSLRKTVPHLAIRKTKIYMGCMH